MEDTYGSRPPVSIQLPIFNEKYVVHRLVEACICIAENYGKEKVNILIIDDSDDETVAKIDEIVRDYSKKHFHIKTLRRQSREGFKSGALQAALVQTKEEFIAVFDADFIPPVDFLVRTIPFLIQNDRVSVVQSRWTHINRDFNVFTKAIALGIDIHFLIEQPARFAAGCFLTFNGSGGVLRKKALLEAGGWQSDTLAEDLDVSYRMQMLGYKIIYLKDLLSPGEIPPTVPSYKKQQGRWACGSLRTARKLLPTLMADQKFEFGKRLQAFIHLTDYSIHPLMFFSFLFICFSALLRLEGIQINLPSIFIVGNSNAELISTSILITMRNISGILFALLIGLSTISAWLYPLVVLNEQNMPVQRNLLILIILFLLGCGLSINNTIEVFKGLFTKRVWTFNRTPKYANLNNKEEWRMRKYQVPLDWVCFLELAFAGLGGSAIISEISHSNFGVLLFLVPFTISYGFVAVLTILQSK